MSDETIQNRWIAGPWVIALVAGSSVSCAIAQEQTEHRNKQVPPDPIRQIRELEEQTKQIGPWESEAQIIADAHFNIFQRNGWNSEPDLFTLDLINQVTRVAPWNVAEREEIFLNGIQQRYTLTHDQRVLTAREMRAESMKVAMKPFTEMMPVVMEIAQTRARKEPFTAEKVQKWSAKFDPIMEDALQAVERVRRKLEGTMNEDQRRRLDIDMEAVVKRHKDVVEMIKDWKAGNWNPTHWGLQNDPIHAGEMAKFRIRQAEHQGLVDAALLKRKPDMRAVAGDESEWERYVKWFCNTYKCDDRQRASAKGILKDSLKRATDYLHARGREIDKARRLSQEAETETARAYHAEELERLRAPVRGYFKSLCDRLEKQVLTSEQQRLLLDANTAEAKKKAMPEVAAKR
ncbi:MAG: hypothetical protein ACE5EC_05120 [Phycisphaerae bacterium]